MTGHRRRMARGPAVVIPLLAAAITVGLAGAPLPASSTAAGTQGANRAAVIVHTGSVSSAVCLRFDEPSLSGMTALQRAGFGASIRNFSGQGSAVCGIDETGCPADASCLTCQAPSYWAYHQAAPGAGAFTSSPVGSDVAQVADGSVEGWQWGTGSPPPFRSVDDVCGREPSSAAGAPPPSADDAPVAAATVTTSGDSGSPVGVTALGLLLAAIAGGAWWIRRSRARGA